MVFNRLCFRRDICFLFFFEKSGCSVFTVQSHEYYTSLPIQIIGGIQGFYDVVVLIGVDAHDLARFPTFVVDTDGARAVENAVVGLAKAPIVQNIALVVQHVALFK